MKSKKHKVLDLQVSNFLYALFVVRIFFPMHSVIMPSFTKFSLTSFLNLVTILLHDMLGPMKLLFLHFSDHLLPRRHKAFQNLETTPLQIDFEQLSYFLSS